MFLAFQTIIIMKMVENSTPENCYSCNFLSYVQLWSPEQNWTKIKSGPIKPNSFGKEREREREIYQIIFRFALVSSSSLSSLNQTESLTRLRNGMDSATETRIPTETEREQWMVEKDVFQIYNFFSSVDQDIKSFLYFSNGNLLEFLFSSFRFHFSLWSI